MLSAVEEHLKELFMAIQKQQPCLWQKYTEDVSQFLSMRCATWHNEIISYRNCLLQKSFSRLGMKARKNSIEMSWRTIVSHKSLKSCVFKERAWLGCEVNIKDREAE